MDGQRHSTVQHADVPLTRRRPMASVLTATSAEGVGAAQCTSITPNGSLPDPLAILLVGEGNLSFTYALVRRLSRSCMFRRATQDGSSSPASAGAAEERHKSVARVVTTTFDHAAELEDKYPESASYRAYFAEKQRVPVRYCGSVNATALPSSLGAQLTLRDQPFHLIVFNNPHIGFEDLYRQRSLLSHFFASAAELLRVGPPLESPQEVVVTVCDDQAQRWDLLGCAARNGYVCVAAQPLLSAHYPEYTNRRHQNDSAFPFQRMIQYLFVHYEPPLEEPLLKLRAAMLAWEDDRVIRQRQQPQQPCSFTCEAWLRTIVSFVSADAAAAQEAYPAGSTPSESNEQDALADVTACSDLGSSVNYVASDSQVPLPLLHPKVVAHVLAAMCGAKGQDYFTPYLPPSTWAALYRAQRWAEAHAFTVLATKASIASCINGDESAVPPHLDAAVLGRPLTAKEAKKLERYLSGYGAAMKAKAAQRKKEAADASNIWTCTACCPPRPFATEDDLRQHQASKHSNAVQLAPTLYARVHTQIEKPPETKSSHSPKAAALEAAVDAMSISDEAAGASAYCAVCGLQYKTVEAFEEHLVFLSPQPGEAESDLVCHQCAPAKRFTDRRGLEQHRISKHAGPSRT